jgi:homopolymeric O-antigen transport system permease protein
MMSTPHEPASATAHPVALDVSRDQAAPGAVVRTSKRPQVWLSFLIDAVLAVATAAAAFWFGTGVAGSARPFADVPRLFPIMIVAQLTALLALQGLTRRLPIDWLVRVAGGVLSGTAIGLGAIGAWFGAALVAPVFIVHGVLLTGAVIAWRTVWMLAARAQARAQTRDEHSALVDRGEQLTTLRGVAFSVYGYRELLKNLVWKDVTLKYRGSVFGFLWSLANPLLMIVVYSVAFTYIIRVRAPHFVFHLMLGQLAWTFFANSAAMSTGAIVDNAGLLKSVLFPRAILPMGTVLFNLVQLLLTLAIFLPVMLIWYGVPISAPMLAFPVVVVLQVLFTIGVALVVATGTAFFRDVRHLLEVALAVLFWTTPVLYSLAQVPERLQPLVLLSPAASYVVAYQQIFIDQSWPQATVWLVTTAYAFGAFVVGALLFLTFEDRFTEQL